MSQPVIKVKGLGKRYRIGLSGSYSCLRETIAKGLKAPFRRLRNAGRRASPNELIWALRDVSFEVRQGELLGIIGRNGAGKTTLLKILSRITEPTEGEVRIRGRVSTLLEVGTGFHPELTGRENIFLNGAILGMTRREIQRKFDEIVAFAEIERFIDTPVKRYSSGMYVRLAFAVAAHLEPEILLVDEVLAVGDVAFQKKCLGKMGDVSGKGRTVLFVSHNMSAISLICPRAILLDHGRITTSGMTAQVIEHYLSGLRGSVDRQEAELFYADEPTLPAQIKRIRISDPDGRPSLRHDLVDPIRVDAEFVVRHDFPNLFVGCTVLSSTGQIVYTTNELDWANYTGPEMNGIYPKASGHYQASVVLPAPLLQPGTYELWLALSDQRTRGNIENRRGIFIEVSDNRGSFASFPFKRNGVVAVPLQWQVEHRDSAHVSLVR